MPRAFVATGLPAVGRVGVDGPHHPIVGRPRRTASAKWQRSVFLLLLVWKCIWGSVFVGALWDMPTTGGPRDVTARRGGLLCEIYLWFLFCFVGRSHDRRPERCDSAPFFWVWFPFMPFLCVFVRRTSTTRARAESPFDAPGLLAARRSRHSHTTKRRPLRCSAHHRHAVSAS